MPVLPGHFMGSSITSRGVSEERHPGIGICLSSFDVKSASELPAFTSIY